MRDANRVLKCWNGEVPGGVAWHEVQSAWSVADGSSVDACARHHRKPRPKEMSRIDEVCRSV